MGRDVAGMVESERRNISGMYHVVVEPPDGVRLQSTRNIVQAARRCLGINFGTSQMQPVDVAHIWWPFKAVSVHIFWPELPSNTIVALFTCSCLVKSYWVSELSSVLRNVRLIPDYSAIPSSETDTLNITKQIGELPC